MSQSCPVSGRRTDENVARIVAGIVVLLALISVLLGSALPLVLLVLDFGIRGFSAMESSPLKMVAHSVKRLARLDDRPIDLAPKRFAARIGFVLSALGIALFAVGADSGGAAVIGILAFCAFLESAFSFCLGCRIYALLPQGAAELLSR